MKGVLAFSTCVKWKTKKHSDLSHISFQSHSKLLNFDHFLILNHDPFVNQYDKHFVGWNTSFSIKPFIFEK